MGKPKKKKGKIRIKTGARMKRKSEQPKDTLKKAPIKTTLPTNGITFKVKVKKK